MPANFKMEKEKYWVAVVSKEHTLRGVQGNFMQVCHGKQAPLKRLRQNDWLLVYSPKLSMEGDQKCQCFTAIGRASDENVYQFQLSENFIPFRRNIKFYKCQETSILPLIKSLEFIPDKNRWGYPFRFGFFEIKENDFNLIASNMLQNENRR